MHQEIEHWSNPWGHKGAETCCGVGAVVEGDDLTMGTALSSAIDACSASVEARQIKGSTSAGRLQRRYFLRPCSSMGYNQPRASRLHNSPFLLYSHPGGRSDASRDTDLVVAGGGALLAKCLYVRTVRVGRGAS